MQNIRVSDTPKESLPRFDYASVPLTDPRRGHELTREGAYPIRLVKLHPSSTGEKPLIQIVFRQNDEKYEALSYCWGPESADDGEKDSISVFGHEYRSMRVRPNLFAALQHLRHTDKIRTFWIDAICINQDDHSEKSQQIPMMDKIYNNASNVCIWLGESVEDDELAFRHMNEITRFEAIEKLISPDRTRHWAALAALMKREWFSRRWVVQEIAFARSATVHCGKSKIDWPDLSDAVALFGSKATEIAELFKADPKFNHQGDYLGETNALGANRLVQTISKTFRKADNGSHTEKLLSLEALVSNLSPFKASTPHDIIYAILSLANDTKMSSRKMDIDPVRAKRPGNSRRGSFAGTAGEADSQRAPQAGALNGTLLTPTMSESRNNPRGRIGVLDTIQREPNSIPDSEDHWIELITQDTLQTLIDENEAKLTLQRVTSSIERLEDDAIPDNISSGTLDDLPPIPRSFWNEANLFVAKSAKQDAKAHRHRFLLAVRLLLYEAQKAEDVSKVWEGRLQNKTFHVDYKDKGFFDVCQDFIRFTITMSKSLDMLCRPWAPDKEDLPADARQLPSWVCRLSKSPFRPRPDGNFGRANADLLVGMPDVGTTYSASSKTKPDWEFGQDSSRSLFVRGVCIDVIQATATEAIEGNIPHEWLELAGWKDLDPPESFWRTIVADRDEQGHNPPSYYRRACRHVFGQRTSGSSLNIQSLISTTKENVMLTYLKRVQAVVWMRKLIRTASSGEIDGDGREVPADPKSDIPQIDGHEQDDDTSSVASDGQLNTHRGRLGLAPHNARAGDKICVLRGCSVPVVLRELKPTNKERRPTRERLEDPQVIDEPAEPEMPPPRGKRTKKRHRPTLQQASSEKRHKNLSLMRCQLIGECYVHGVMDGESFRISGAGKRQEHEFEIR